MVVFPIKKAEHVSEKKEKKIIPQGRVSPCIPGFPGLELRNLPASVSLVLGLGLCESQLLAEGRKIEETN